jgi:outer membrane receptor for ferrienterochelin and colicins
MTMTRVLCLLTFGLPIWLSAAVAGAQTKDTRDLLSLSMEDLLKVEVVSSASKFPQEVKEAPASITVITASEMRRYGHRTLADTLASVRGFYTTYDRNYSYVGMRGFARPGDYNTRVLLLIDGQRLNDPIYDMAPIGTDFPIDISLIERVEVIRGPGSSLYGTNAVMAVINVITRTGAHHDGLRADTSGGSLGTRGVTLSFGKLLSKGREMLLAGSLQRANGAGSLYYPEFDQGGPGSGVATGLDHDEASKVFGSMAIGRFSISGGAVSRRKQIPTAAFETVFDDGRQSIRDDRAYVNAIYEGSLRRGWSIKGRLAYDYYGYEGHFPYDYGEPEPVIWLDLAQSHTASGEITLQRRFAGKHLVTVGAEVRHQLRNRMTAEDNSGVLIDVNRPGTVAGTYVQDEMRVFPWLLVNAGVRLDRYPTFGSRATPRVGLVLLPRPQTAVKLLHGRAFRAPNPYERYYYPGMQGRQLDPEDVQNTEAVWEEYLSTRVRSAVTAFRYRVGKLIEQAAVETEFGPGLIFRNGGGVRGSGVEAEIEVKLARGVASRFSHAYARTHDSVSGGRLANSPLHLSKLGLQVPVASFFVGLEGQYVGERLTLDGGRLRGSFIPNLMLSSPAARRLDFTLGIYNVFNRAHSDPGGEEHLQRSIPQDGRTALVRARVRF